MENKIKELCRQVEVVVGRPIKSSKDFNWLSELIFEKQHERISDATLKRLWGYVPSSSVPRSSTLDLLCQFIGVSSWEVFCKSPLPSSVGDTTSPSDTGGVTAVMRWLKARRWWLTAMVAAAVVVFFWMRGRTDASPDVKSEPYVLHCGDRFASTDDYLPLFGIAKTWRPWGVPLPNHDFVVIWGPKYNQPNWHNTGDVDKMMPTITEWWDDPDSLRQVVYWRNKNRYDTFRRLGEVRVTFMKDLVDTGYVFLGVYLMSMSKSNEGKIVWERIFDECDVTRVGDLEALRNPDIRSYDPSLD